MPKTTSRSSEVSVNVVPDPSNVVGFPLSEKKAKIIRDPYGNFRVVVRRYYWDPVDQRGKENGSTWGMLLTTSITQPRTTAVTSTVTERSVAL